MGARSLMLRSDPDTKEMTDAGLNLIQQALTIYDSDVVTRTCHYSFEKHSRFHWRIQHHHFSVLGVIEFGDVVLC